MKDHIVSHKASLNKYKGIKIISYILSHHNGIKLEVNSKKANRKRGTGTREKVRSRGVGLEGNTHTQEISVSQLPV
jgi:hypothetical protein